MCSSICAMLIATTRVHRLIVVRDIHFVVCGVWCG